MAAPQPMVKPDFFGVKKEGEGVITVYLPQASEEYGPIRSVSTIRTQEQYKNPPYKEFVTKIYISSHYYLVVIPFANSTKIKHPDYYDSSDLTTNSQFKAQSSKDSKAEDEADSKPYITAKFLGRSIPYTFPLGDGKMYEGFQNRRLHHRVHYKVFVRAYVDVPRKHLYTSSPFSPNLSLDMPYGE